MTVSNAAGVWKPLPDAGYYEACDVGGLVRSIDRTIGGRFYPGKELTPKRTGTSRYWQVKYTGDDGKPHTVPVGVCVLRAHVGMPKPGQQCCHADDNPDNNDLSNLRWDDAPGNVLDRMENTPRRPRPVKECVRCGDGFAGNGRRCHRCVVEIGQEAARLLRDGTALEDAAEALEYPSVSGLHTLAVKYGGYGQSRSRRVRQRLGAWLAGGDSR